MTQIIDNKIREERGETFYRLQVCLGREVFLNKYGLDKEELYDKITCENIRSILKESLEDIRKWKQQEMFYPRSV